VDVLKGVKCPAVSLVEQEGITGVMVYFYEFNRGLDLSHKSAFNTLRNLRITLQGKLENQPLGNIEDIGTGALKNTFIDEIDNLELILAHSLSEGFISLAVPLMVYIAMFFVDWRLTLLFPGSLLVGLVSMGLMFAIGMFK
jgi:ATP-binding cassette subfamily B protein